MLYQIEIIEAQFIFHEKVNLKKAVGLLKGLGKTAIKNTFFKKEEIDKGTGFVWKQTSYLSSIMKYLKTQLPNKTEEEDNSYTIERTYKYGKNRNGGRLYVENMGLQLFQSDLKNYLSGEYYCDIDIINCIPSIMLYVCDTNKLSTNYLKQYVENREDILNTQNLTKDDIIKALNKDRPYRKGSNHWYNAFIEEIKALRIEILNIIQPLNINTSNLENPVSSIVGEYFKIIEGDIIQQVIKYVKEIESGLCIIPMFDGLNIEKRQSIDYEDLLNKVNEIFVEKMKYIKFRYKSLDSDIELNIDDTDFNDYHAIKLKFEEKYFHVKQPFSYWAKSKNTDNSYGFYQLTATDFKLACEPYQIDEMNEKGDFIRTSIYSKWLKDADKMQYETIDFVPYGKTSTCPSHVYNTFDGFEIEKYKDNDVSSKYISNFKELLRSLVNDDEEKYKYLLNYLAHTFQYPNIKTEQIMVFAGWTGTGKDSLFRTMQRLMGVKYVDITENIDDLFGQFNSILDSKVMLFINEVEGKHATAHQEKLKGLATAVSNRINEKNRKAYNQKNYVRIMLLSNALNPVNIQMNDRRYVFFKTGFKLVKNVKDATQREYATKFWDKYNEDINNINWLKSLYNYLMAMDLTNFNYKNPPKSEEKEIMKSKNIKKIYLYVKALIDENAYEGFILDKKKGIYMIKFKEFFNNYKNWLEMQGITPEYKIKEADIKLELGRCDNSFTADKRIQIKIKGNDIDGRYSCFSIPRLKEWLNNYVFTEEEDQAEEIKGDFEYGENKNEMFMNPLDN